MTDKQKQVDKNQKQKDLERQVKKLEKEVLTLKKNLNQEIIHREQIEKALNKNQKSLIALYKYMPIPTFTWKRKGKDFILIDFNDAALENTNGKVVDYLGVSAEKFYQDRPKIIEDMEKCYTEKRVISKEVFYTFKSIKKSGYFDTTYAFIPPDRIIVHTQDITQRKQYEKRLQESEERFRQMVELSPFPISIVDRHGTYLYINKKFTELFGYSIIDIPTEMDWFSYAFPEEKSREEAIIQWKSDILLIDSRRITQRPFNIHCKDGSIRNVFFRPVNLSKNRLFITYEDITDREMAEEALREKEQKLTGITSTILDFMIMLDENYKISWANDVVKKTFGEGILGEKCHKIFFDNDEPCNPCVAKDTFNDRTTHNLEKVIYKTNGKKMFLSLTASIAARYADGRPKLIVEVLKDDTVRVRTLEALKKSEENYRNLFNDLPIGLFLSTPEGKMIDANQTLVQILRCPDKEYILSHNAIEGYVNPEDRTKLISLLNQNQIVLNFETELKRYDGTLMWASLHMRTIKDQVGNILHYEGAVIDITERKLAEQEKEKLECQIRSIQRMEAIGTLAGGIAYDFNYIFSFILGYAELTLSEAPPNSQIINNMEQIIQACDRAKEIVKQILTFSRQIKQEHKPVQIVHVVKEAIKLIRSSIPKTIKIQEKINITSHMIIGDLTQIQQIVINLCTNSYQAMREKGGVLKIELDCITLNSKSEAFAEKLELKEGRYIRLIISDTGHGIDKVNLERIFDPFFTTKPKGEGIGLGLSIVHGIVKSHNGALSIDSTLGEGTTVQVYLPLLESLVPAQESPYESSLKGTERVLFIDDEEHFNFIVKKTLTNFGYTVTIMTSSIEALAIFKTKALDFDIVFTDFSMPHMTGDKLAIEMLKIQPKIPIVLITAFTEKFTPEMIKKIGISEFITKPFLVRDLARII